MEILLIPLSAQIPQVFREENHIHYNKLRGGVNYPESVEIIY